MPRTETVLRMLVAAPDDVKDEVIALSEVVSELNRALAQHQGTRLEIVNWRTDAAPGFGEDAQAVINAQLGHEYDIFVGILWTRFGTPTLRAGSGTEEEFNRALRKYREKPNAVRIWIYFKTGALSSDDIEPTQLASVHAFRRRVSDEGGLYSQFSDRDDFTTRIRLHLTQEVQTWGRHAPEASKRRVADGVNATSESGSEGLADCVEEGYLDLVETSTACFARSLKAVVAIGELLEEISTRTNLSTRQANAVREAPADQRAQMAKNILAIAATDLNHFARGIKDQTSEFSAAFASAVDTMSKALAYSEFWSGQDAEREGLLESLAILDAKMQESNQVMVDLRVTIGGLPRLTTAFNAAKKNAASALDEHGAAVAHARGLLLELKRNPFFGGQASDKPASSGVESARDGQIHGQIRPSPADSREYARLGSTLTD